MRGRYNGWKSADKNRKNQEKFRTFRFEMHLMCPMRLMHNLERLIRLTTVKHVNQIRDDVFVCPVRVSRVCVWL